MGAVNGWYVGGGEGVRGIWEMSVQPKEMGKDFCPNFLQPLLENFDKRTTEVKRSVAFLSVITHSILDCSWDDQLGMTLSMDSYLYVRALPT